MKKISVIVPVYNSEKFISECIESVLNQTYENFELILVNDGSTDSSGDICREYELQDKRVRCIFKENGGVSSARNYGIQHAAGEYIAFVDSDDIVKPEMFENLMRPNSDFAMCGYELYDDISKNVSIKYRCPELCGNVFDLAQNIRDYLSPPYLLGPCFKMFRRDIINANGLSFPPELSYGEDAIFVLEYLTFCKTVDISPYVGYSYRKHGNESLSGKFLINKIDINHRINELIGELLRKENISQAKRITSDRLLNCFVSYTEELICSKLSEKEKHRTFYKKYECYKNQLCMPRRLAQIIVIIAGNCRFCYPLLYLFKMKGR